MIKPNIKRIQVFVVCYFQKRIKKETKMKIFIVEDDRALNNGIALSLTSYEVRQAFCLKEAREKIDASIVSRLRVSE